MRWSRWESALLAMHGAYLLNIVTLLDICIVFEQQRGNFSLWFLQLIAWDRIVGLGMPACSTTETRAACSAYILRL
jgi:hypothetical protein